MAGRTARKVFRAEVGANVGVSKVRPLTLGGDKCHRYSEISFLN